MSIRSLIATIIRLIRECIELLLSVANRAWKWTKSTTSLRSHNLIDIVTTIPTGYPRTMAFEKSLFKSKELHACYLVELLGNKSLMVGEFSDKVSRMLILNSGANLILVGEGRKFSLKSNKVTNDLLIPIRDCLEIIYSYKYLVKLITTLSQQECSWQNPTNEKMLLAIWNNLVDDEVLIGNVSSQWGRLGFQGKSPITDFRGCGDLALNFLTYLSIKYKDTCKDIIKRLRNPNPAFELPFALIAIHSTDIGLKLCQSDKAKTHFYNVLKSRSNDYLYDPDQFAIFELDEWDAKLLIEFFEFTTAILFELVERWTLTNVKIMEYVPLKNGYVKKLEQDLTGPNYFKAITL